MDKIKGKNVLVVLVVLVVLLILLSIPRGEVRLGRGFSFYEEPSFISYSRKHDSLHVDNPPQVLSYKNTLNYLLVMQHPEKYDNVMFSRYEYPYGRDRIYYWFIDKRSKEVVGPMPYPEMYLYLKGKNKERLLEKMLKNYRN